MAKLKINYNKDKFQNNSAVLKYSMVMITIFLICLFLPNQPRFRYDYQKGKAWNHENLVSPYNFAILKTPEELDRDRQNILKTVQPIYNLNEVVAKEQIDQFNIDLNERWQSEQMDTLVSQGLETYRGVGLKTLEYIYDRGIISLNSRYQARGESGVSGSAAEYNFILVQNNVAQQRNTANSFIIESAYTYIENTVDNSRNIEQKKWLTDLLKNYVAINYVFNEAQTDRAEQAALANISTTRGIVQKDELIAEQGKIINNETFQKLESLRRIYEDEAQIEGKHSLVVFGNFLMVSLIMALLMVFLYFFRRDIFNNNRLLSIIFILTIAMLGVLSWAIQFKMSSIYFIPYCSVPIIFRVLFDTRIALNIHLLMVLMASLFVPNSFDFVFLQLITGIVAIYSIRTIVKREQFLLSSLIILASYIIAYTGLVLTRNGSFNSIYWNDILPFFVSVGLTLLAYPLIYAFERLFGIVSDLTLMELTNSNSKLLRELSMKAPGTFQHSLQVANLAEAAMYRIGGNPLLIRAGSLYHDIGKMTNPLYFIENQRTGNNPHKELTPEQSAQIIISHVLKGVEIARKNQLPEVVVDFIRTHHGTTKVDYFYNLAVKNNPDKLVDAEIFRYPGPIPFTKEAAVLMIADSVEAASRSMKEHTVESINKLVDNIIDHKLIQKQFMNANITMKEISEVATIFKSMLKSIYHVRIDYDLNKNKATEE